MEKEKRNMKRIVTIRIEPYLSEYINGKYGIDYKYDGVRIPHTSDLYFCIWEHMAKKRRNQEECIDGNLRIILPCRKTGSGTGPWKDPAYYNYLSISAARAIELQIRMMFNFELHRILLENEEFGRERSNIDVINDFIHRYRLKSISSDALLKNYYRYRNRIWQKKPRKYVRNKRFNVF